MQRALKRSGIPAWYSEGFNPRIYLNFPLALSLGTEGEREPMDFYVTEDITAEEICSRLDRVCPEGLRILSAGSPVYPNKEIGFGEYEADFRGDFEELSAALNGFTEQDEIKVLKHSKKKGTVTVDIKPCLEIIGKMRTETGLRCCFRLPAGNDLNINAGLFTDAFSGFCKSKGVRSEIICIKRIKILLKNGEEFA